MIEGVAAHMTGDDAPITDLLGAWRSGNRDALQRLIPLVYDTLRSSAARQIYREGPGQMLRPTDLVHEMFLKLDGAQRIEWENRGHFFAIAAKLMRQVLVGQARQRKAEKRGGDHAAVSLEDGPDIPLSDRDSAWLIDLDDALLELANEDVRKAEIVEMRYFGGLTCPEIATELTISISTVERETRMALAWLRLRLGGKLDGNPLGQPG